MQDGIPQRAPYGVVVIRSSRYFIWRCHVLLPFPLSFDNPVRNVGAEDVEAAPLQFLYCQNNHCTVHATSDTKVLGYIARCAYLAAHVRVHGHVALRPCYAGRSTFSWSWLVRCNVVTMSLSKPSHAWFIRYDALRLEEGAFAVEDLMPCAPSIPLGSVTDRSHGCSSGG